MTKPPKALPSGAASAPTPKELAGYDLNDYGNALRLIRIAGGEVRDGVVDQTHIRLLYLDGFGWVGFNGKFWDKRCGEQLARQLAHKVAISLRGLASDLIKKTGKAEGKVLEFCERAGQAGATSAMLKQAEPYLTVAIDVFDQHPMTLNFANGTLWLTDKAKAFKPTLKPHSPADRITRFIEFDYDPKAKAPLFRKTVEDALDEPEKRGFFQRVLGYSATGEIYEQAYFLCQGLGRDGKSTILNAARLALGGYGGVGDVKTFLDIGQQGASNASPDLAKLAGDIRMVMLSEPPRDARLNESLIKQWTGGDPVQARELREKPFEFIPVGKLMIQCNAFPVAKGNDDGIWRRTYPIPFENQVDIAKVDRQLPEKLKVEYPGIINWVIDGVEDWLRRGLDPPESIIRAREDYRAQSSPFIDWLNERCVHGKAAGTNETASKVLYDNFKQWSEDQGQDKIMSATIFGRAMSERQIRKVKRHGNIYRTPIRLKTLGELSSEGNAPQPPNAFSASATMSSGGDPTAFGAFGGEDETWR